MTTIYCHDGSCVIAVGREDAAQQLSQDIEPQCSPLEVEEERVEDAEECDSRFELIEHHDTIAGSPWLLETYGEEFARVQAADPRHVWTVVDGDNGLLYLVAGLHYVNRVNYVLSRRPWVTGNETFLWA